MIAEFIKVQGPLGLEVKISSSWIMVAVFLVWSLSTAYFPIKVPDIKDSSGFMLAAVAMVGVFASVVFHELAHIIVARKNGVEIKRTTLYFFGGLAEMETLPRSVGTEIWNALAGLIASLFLCIVFWGLSNAAAPLGFSAETTALFSLLGEANLLLVLFNLLPTFPLDGGRIYRALLWRGSGDLVRATRQASRPGMVLAPGAMLIGLYMTYFTETWAGLWLFLAGFFLFTTSRLVLSLLKIQAGLSEKSVSQMMSKFPLTIGPSKSLCELEKLVISNHCVNFVPVEEDDQLLGYVDSRVLHEIDRENWSSTAVNDVLVSLRPEDYTTLATSAERVLDQLLQSDRGRLMVVQKHRLVGVISVFDFVDYVRVLRQINSELSLPEKGGF